jgi:hypothetical protein
MILFVYLLIGVIWTAYIFLKNNTIRKSQKEHWFPILLFSLTLWPLFMYFNYDRGVLFNE